MHPYKSILAYASREDTDLVAVDQAAALACETGASLTIVRVLEDGGSASRAPDTSTISTPVSRSGVPDSPVSVVPPSDHTANTC